MKSEAESSSLGKSLRTSFGNFGHSIANAFGKAVFHSVCAVIAPCTPDL